MRIDEAWPPLPYDAWRDTKATLHMFTQVLGKVRLALAPVEPEWQHAALYVTPSGITTGPVPAAASFEAAVDLVGHRFMARSTNGDSVGFALPGRSVAEFYNDVLEGLSRIGVAVELNPDPQEVPDPIPFPQDDRDAYDPASVTRYHRALTSIERVLSRFRAGFMGRHTRVQFFWGSFDLTYTRFSGRPADPPPGAGVIGIPAMDAEQFCCGFWPGDDRSPAPGFFSYAFPRPDGLERAPVRPGAWNDALGEFLLPYEDARLADSPDEAVLAFLRTTYDAASRLGSWPALSE
jgi:hypothetical protein